MTFLIFFTATVTLLIAIASGVQRVKAPRNHSYGRDKHFYSKMMLRSSRTCLVSIWLGYFFYQSQLPPAAEQVYYVVMIVAVVLLLLDALYFFVIRPKQAAEKGGFE